MKRPASSATSSSPRQPLELATSCCICPLACLLSKICTTETLPGECEPMWRGLLIDSHCFSQVLESSSFPSFCSGRRCSLGQAGNLPRLLQEHSLLKSFKDSSKQVLLYHSLGAGKYPCVLQYHERGRLNAEINTLENFIL